MDPVVDHNIINVDLYLSSKAGAGSLVLLIIIGIIIDNVTFLENLGRDGPISGRMLANEQKSSQRASNQTRELEGRCITFPWYSHSQGSALAVSLPIRHRLHFVNEHQSFLRWKVAS
jgi:hypothetical protein